MFLPNEAMQVIADAALLLCTSDEEGFPNMFTQAWASGTPIVTLKVDPDNIIEKMGWAPSPRVSRLPLTTSSRWWPHPRGVKVLLVVHGNMFLKDITRR